MEIAWANLFKLTEDFIISFLALRLIPGYSFLHTLADHTSVKSPWKVMTTTDYEKLVATEDWESKAGEVRCLTEYREVLTNQLVSERRTIIVSVPCKEGLVICADQKLSMTVGDSTIHDAVKIHRLSPHVAFGVVGNSIFCDPFNPSKVLYSVENVVKAFFTGRKYIPEDWSDFAKTVTDSFAEFAGNVPQTHIVLGGPPPDHFIFDIGFWYLTPDGELGTYTFSLQFIREIGRVHPFRMEAPAETFETARASAWGNGAILDEIRNGSDSRFDELRNDPELRRFVAEEPLASEVTTEEAVSAANKIIKVSRSMTPALEPIKEAAELEEKTDCAIIHRKTGFKWLSQNHAPPPPPTRKASHKKKKRRQ